MNHAPLDFAPNDERNEPLEARPFSYRLIIALVAIEAVAIGAFLWLAL